MRRLRLGLLVFATQLGVVAPAFPASYTACWDRKIPNPYVVHTNGSSYWLSIPTPICIASMIHQPGASRDSALSFKSSLPQFLFHGMIGEKAVRVPIPLAVKSVQAYSDRSRIDAVLVSRKLEGSGTCDEAEHRCAEGDCFSASVDIHVIFVTDRNMNVLEVSEVLDAFDYRPDRCAVTRNSTPSVRKFEKSRKPWVPPGRLIPPIALVMPH